MATRESRVAPVTITTLFNQVEYLVVTRQQCFLTKPNIKDVIIKLLSFVVIAVLAAGAYYMPREKAGIPVSTAMLFVPEHTVTTPEPTPEELGAVQWIRDYELAKSTAKSAKKPMLILFQEVPGCSNCTKFGNNTLSHPLIVEAIETYFVPVCIYNNKKGKDADILAQYAEPAWNNPVVRIVNAEEKDLTLRMANFNASSQLVKGMIAVLELNAIAVPQYLELLAQELSSRETGTATATYSMGCFWRGESLLGNINGVVETTPGFQDGKEVVRVEYDPVLLKKADLDAIAIPKGNTVCPQNEGFRADKEPKYYLAQTEYQYIPMTSLQACRINTAIGEGVSPDEILSSRQLAFLEKIKAKTIKSPKNMIGRSDLAKAWKEAAE